ncbi:MAG: nucleotide sugar dehydrogenase [Magnetospirillum sp. WYHS-4]
MTVEELRKRFENREARIGVIGLGYVGLPLALAFVEAGFDTTGFDIDPTKREYLAAGRCYLRHIPAARVAAAVARGRFRATEDFSGLGAMDAIVVCVPTPLTRQREPDISFIVSTTETIAKTLRPGQLIVLESTTYPGTTSGDMRPILERGGLKSGRDFFLAFSPEREDPGNAVHTTTTIPKVVGGDGPDALALASALYSGAVDRVVPVSSMETAEAVKLTENIFRSVNIALVNELKVVFARMGIDVWEVIDAAKTKPFGFMPFYPGPGLGGHCIPIDPFYLTWKAREFDIATRFIELAGEINTSMPYYVIDVLVRALSDRLGQSIKGARILLLGIAYKKNVDDMRESPALKLIELLEERGAQVAYHDPFIPVIGPTREHASLAGRESVAWEPAGFALAFDAALICTDHDGIDYAALAEALPLVVDTRNALRAGPNGHGKIVKA